MVKPLMNEPCSPPNRPEATGIKTIPIFNYPLNFSQSSSKTAPLIISCTSNVFFSAYSNNSFLESMSILKENTMKTIEIVTKAILYPFI